MPNWSNFTAALEKRLRFYHINHHRFHLKPVSNMFTSRRFSLMALVIVIALGSGCEPSISDDEALLASLPETVDFNFHIRPLLSDRCYKCHGPDENARETDLRLDTEEGAFGKLTESARNRAIVPGSLRRSELAHRIISDDPDYQMPPPDANLSLSEYEVALLRKWIDQGAEWKPHWAFVPPEKPDVPEVNNAGWPKNPIDNFVLARLEREGVEPADEADKERLLRRVSFDLTGLPPSVVELDAFLADESPDAYEKAVDRLLGTVAYAEHMAVDWMDVSRYADSHGYHADGYRMMWPWRDWVIEAFDDNMPYDEFITVQLAGDLFPNPTDEQRLATAFHRNHQMTAEGGIVDEEYRLEYVADRTNTTARAFMGITMECARCHDHKFDPVTQKEYFQLSAFFNNVNEVGMTADDGNAGPMLMLFEGDAEEQLKTLRDSINALQDLLEQRTKAVKPSEFERIGVSNETLKQGLIDHYELDTLDSTSTSNSVRGREAAGISGDVELVDGPVGKGIRFDYDFDYLELKKAGLFERHEPFSIAFWTRPEKKEPYAELMGNAGQKNSYWRGYEIFVDSLNRVNVRLIHALAHNQLHVFSEEGIPFNEWSHIAVTYDGASKAAGVSIYVDGQKQAAYTRIDNLYKSMLPVNYKYEVEERPMRVGKSYRAFGGDDGIYKGSFDDIRFYDRKLSGLEAAFLSQALLPDDQELRREHYLLSHDEDYREMTDRLLSLYEEEHRLIEPIDEIMVMEEMKTPRTTYLLNRGAYDQPVEEVKPGTPEIILAFDEDLPQNRLGLARWLVDPANPLTARVTVNRFWQMHFGSGIVETPDDFGYQGRLPTHPALMDWLATTFVESGWDLKALNRLIVTSATYRQSSRPRPDLAELDPENRWLARGNSRRLSAEMIRDNALAASGLLVRTVGGPSAKPYQPEGLWIEKNTFSPMLLTYEPDKGDGLYRRSLYTFVKRTSPPPAMLAFDATDRSICIVQRQSTSTPMQSLILMNDPQYVEASRVLAERMQQEAGDDLENQLEYGFRALTSRRPKAEEMELFAEMYREELRRFGAEPADALALLEVGDKPRDAKFDPARTAALTMVVNTMMNHDEAYMRR